MPDPRIPADRQVQELAALYTDAQARLEELVRAALERGAEGTAGYYARQLEAVRKVLAELQDQAVPLATRTASAAYSAGVTAVERSLRGPAVAFSGVHQDAVNVLADNLVNRLNAAAVTVGRRTEDAFRQVGLKTTAHGLATGDARKAVSAELERRLLEQGVTDSLTGFVDRAGRRWPLDTYAEMVARTTTREAVTQGTVNRLLERGDDVVEISSHANPCEVCADYDGGTFSLSGESDEYEALDELPPFHPNCRHVLTPAAANLDAFEAGLRGEA